MFDKKDFDDFIKKLRYHNRGAGVLEHHTSAPIFIVQSKRRIYGIDSDYDPKFCWIGNEGNEIDDDELSRELNRMGIKFDDSEDEIIHDGECIFSKIGYFETWEYVNAHFTKEAAEAFIERKKHDYEELRVYVDSQYLCREFNSIIELLLDGKISYNDKQADYPEFSKWIPHHPETWTHRFANLREPLTMSHYAGYWENGEPVMKDVECKAGRRVKIVMVSRFGDVGITEDLEAEHGYGSRVKLDDLCEFGIAA